MLSVTYSPLLVAASILVAVMAAFTALRLTNGLSALAPARRKPVIAKAAIALGAGIWSMHFVGMLAVQLPIGISYAPVPTLLSVLLAILVTGSGLILLHFGERSQFRIVGAGLLTGIGIVGMHYLGMSAIRGNCVLIYEPIGVLLAAVIAVAASTLGLHLAYRQRGPAQTIGGGVVLGLAVSAMHYTAMAFTFFDLSDKTEIQPVSILSSDSLALLVSLASFLICGVFLLIAIPAEAETHESGLSQAEAAPKPEPAPPPAPAAVYSQALSQPRNPKQADAGRIPFERDSAIRFLAAEQIAAVRADGHYTWLLNGEGELFCPWSISRVEQAVAGKAFLRTHRSYLINLSKVAGFRREGDRGICLLADARETEVPVSRSKLPDVQKALGLS
ncbi:MAG: LytTR family transcriptional regulator DNA-binding domain-containing protein [Rhodospirillales bacterium]|nr:LytTR family transcriptional regulator DNA-binding domain-containing protein [Rhodospirillales bacterium]